VTDAVALDRLTVKLATAVPYPALIAFLPHHLVVPKHDVEAVGDNFFAENPIGTSPFRFVRRDKGVQIVMKRYDNNYYGARRRSRLWARPSWTA